MIERIISYLQDNNFIVEKNDGKIITTHFFKEIEFKISGKLGANFPFQLPKLYLLEREKYGKLAHITWNNINNTGLICEGVSINRNIDYSQPELIYEKSLQNAIKIIEDCLSDFAENEKEIMKEFNAHWRCSVSNTNNKPVINFVEPSETIKSIKIFKTSDNKICFIDYDSCINKDYKFLKRLEYKFQIVDKGIYLPIKNPILPPNPNDNIKEWWGKLIANLPFNHKKELLKISKHNKSKVFWIIASINVNTYNNWFCLKFENKYKDFPPLSLKGKLEKWDIIAFDVILHNKDYINPRGGSFKNNQKKVVALIGCGAIGAEISNQIVSTGLIKKLILVDYDSMNIENIQRHFLGGKNIGESKKVAIAKELNSKFPYVEVEVSSKQKLSECLDENFLNLVDGIIIATGNPTDERYFNEEIFKKKSRPWIIYSWVEGHGIGGHAIYTHKIGKGCLNCLYRDKNGNKSLYSIQNFLEGNQNVAVDISGCGSYFLPYSYLDAIQTAILTVRLAIQALSEKLDNSCRVSWKSEVDTTFDLKTTYRYNQTSDFSKPTELYWKECDICNE